MNERVYQGMIGILLIVVMVAFYFLYENGEKPESTKRMSAVDIVKSKPVYKDVDTRKVLVQTHKLECPLYPRQFSIQ